jgi:intracellular sulfur oxidation DsrE/DsrF family protein
MSEPTFNRRTIVSGSVLAAGLMAATQSPSALARTENEIWRPAREPQDAWLDKPGTRHRLVVDSATATAAAEAVSVADTFYASNASGYGLGPETLGVVIVLRHLATPFGYNDAVWSKYGTAFADKLRLSGRSAIRAVHGNPLLGTADLNNGSEQSKAGASRTPTLASLQGKGARFAVCGAATAYLAKVLAGAGGESTGVEHELQDNLIPGGVLMASGIVAVNRAQEQGYAIVATTP